MTHSEHTVPARTGLLETTARFRRDTRGSFAVWTAVMALPLALSVGVAMDIQRAGRDHSTLKATLDAAVLAAVNNNAIDDRERKAFAEQAFRDDYDGAPVVRLESAVNKGRVSLEATVRTDLTLASMMGLTELEVSSRSTAYLNTPDIICALALNETEAGAITFGEIIDFDARTCSVQSNSRHADAILSLGMQGPRASNFCAHGGTTGMFQPGGTGECSRVRDPYKTLKMPEPGECQSLLNSKLVDLSSLIGEAPAQGTQGAVPILDANIGISSQAAPVDLPVNDADLLQKAEAVLRNIMGDDSDDLEDFRWEDEDGVRQIHIKFESNEVNPFGKNKTHHIPENDVPAFIAKYGNQAVPATLAEDSDARYTVATVTLGDGRTVDVEDDDSHTLVDTGAVLKPGTYCGGLTVAGADVTLLPGTYHMMDGPFVVKDTASVVGEGVTVVLAGNDAHLKVESEGRLSLKAPKRGALKGLVVAEDTRRPSVSPDDEVERLTSRITSGGKLIVTGTVYLPTHAVEVTGDDSGLGSHAPSTSFIADTLHFGGSGMIDIRVDHQAADLPPVEPRSEDGARLVE